jgi:uncharacterized cupin superfamily protein
VHALPQGRQGRKSRLSARAWFVVNVADAPSFGRDGLGSWIPFERDGERFEEFGINIHVLRPGEPSSMYHAEESQEDFLVLYGECLLIVAGEERPLKAWDFFHCPPWTEHVFVGAGARPCAILMVGGRGKQGLRYPVSDAALRHGAGVEEETTDGRVAYARFGDTRPGEIPSSGLPWQAT